MDTARHSSADRIRIAQLTGITVRHAAHRIHGTYDQAAAIAELHTVTSDPHLLAHATPNPRHHLFRTARTLLLAAGADPDDLAEIAAHQHAQAQQVGFPIGENADIQAPPAEGLD